MSEEGSFLKIRMCKVPPLPSQNNGTLIKFHQIFMLHNDLEGGSSGNLGPAIGICLTSGAHSSVFLHVINCFRIVFPNGVHSSHRHTRKGS
jgi:hypothetical protein